MAIGTCPTNGEACNFIPAFRDEDYIAPEYTQHCRTREEAAGQGITRFCGYYVELVQKMVASANTQGEQI